MKKIFSLIFVICFLFIGTASAQWWVRGGNLLWPYGDVSIQKNLDVGGEVNLDSNVTIGADLTVSGDISSSGVTEVIAYVDWNSLSDPTVTYVKNNIGTLLLWDNVDDLGERVEVSASDPIFVSGKTSVFSTFLNFGGANYFIYGERISDTVFRFTCFNANGDTQQAVPDLPVILSIQVYE